MKAITAERLRELFWYDSETGVFKRRVRVAGASADGTVGTRHSMGYISVGVDRQRHLAHRLAWLYVYGQFPPCGLDHINGNRADNRIRNLRVASQQENIRNSAMPITNTSGFKGVYWDRQHGRWRAAIHHCGRSIFLGLFTDIGKAREARMAAEAELFGEFSVTRRAAS